MKDPATHIEETIHRTIPLSNTLGFHIESLTPESIHVTAPLEPNINIHQSAFAGSIYSVGALTAWAMVTNIVAVAGINASVVIGKAEIFYQHPINDAIHCRIEPGSALIKAFLDDLRSNQRGKISLVVEIGVESAATLNAVVFAKVE